MGVTAKRPSALVMCGADPASDPRPQRMIRCLARDFDVHVISRGGINLPGVTCEQIAPPRCTPFARKLLTVLRMRFLRDYRAILWTPGLRELAARNRRTGYDFIAVHDLLLLPMALAIRSRGRLVFDAREYYPRQSEDNWWWRTMFQPMATALCRKYLRRANEVITVSPGLAAEYKREFGIHCYVVASLPKPVDLQPSAVVPDRVRMIHHGSAAASRQIERMIDVVRLLPERFTLDLMLVDGDNSYGRWLRGRAAGCSRVTFRAPIPFANLVGDTNQYDVGLYLLAPTSFNTLHALPNKFFEFVQARLMVAIGPSPDMAHYVRQHELGIVADDFSPGSLATQLRALTPEEIAGYKHRAHVAAAVLNSDRTDEIVRALALGNTALRMP